MGGIIVKKVDRVQEWEEMVEEDRQRAIKLKLEAELKKIKQEKLVTAVTMAANHIFQYAPIMVQIRNVEDEHGIKTEETYLWVMVDHDAMQDEEAQAQYPVGVAVNKGGHMHVPSYLTYPERHITYEELPFAFLPPDAPAPPVLQVATSSSITVTWLKADPMEDKYELQVYPLERERYGAQIWRTAANSITDTEYTLEGLPHNMAFQFRLRAHSPFGWSEFSILSTPISTTPSPPEPLGGPPSAVVLPGGTVRLEWPPVLEDNGSPVVSYNVRAKVAGPDTVYELAHTGPETWCELPDLKPGVVYHFQVAARNAYGSSEYSDAATATTPMQHQGLGRRKVPDNALRVMGDWVEVWNEETQSCSYMHLKTGVRRKKPPKERPSTPTRPLTRPRSVSSLGRSPRPSSPLVPGAGNGSLGSLPGAVASPRTPEIVRLGSGRMGLSPLRLHSIHHIRRTGSFSSTGRRSPYSPLVDESKTGRESPINPGDSPEAVFRKKRYRFLCGLRRRSRSRPGTPSTVGNGVLFLPLERHDLFQQSFEKLRLLSAPELRKKLRVDYVGEEGIDAGGLTKDWYLQMSREMFNPEYCLFQRVDSDHRVFTIHPRASVQSDFRAYFRFVGRLLAKAVHDVQLVDLPWAGLLYKHILGQRVGFAELQEMDEVFAKSLTWMLENDITDIIHETFCVIESHFGSEKEIPLKPGGADIDVTEENKQEYVDLVVEYKTTRSIAEPLEALKAGFYDVVPWEAIRIFSVDELELLLNGKPVVDLDDLRKSVVYQGGISPETPVVKLFWEAMASFDQDKRGQVLQFTTGTSRVPLDGYVPPLTITAASDLGPDALPKAHTCFNQIVLPDYPTLDLLVDKLTYAVDHAEGFLLG